jgi:hypothetical protein
MWEHLAVAQDHWGDDGSAEHLEFAIIDLQGRTHCAEGLIAFLLRHQRQIPTQLGKQKRGVHSVRATVSLLEKRLRVGDNCFCHGSHRISPSPELEPNAMRHMHCDVASVPWPNGMKISRAHASCASAACAC